MARLSAAEKHRSYRERLKKNPEKYEEAKRKHREHYHKVKKLVKDLTPKERKHANIIWKLRQRQYRNNRKNVQAIVSDTPPCSPVSGVLNADAEIPRASPVQVAARKRGRKQVRRNSRIMRRENKKLKEQNDNLRRKLEKYKKRLMREKKTLESKNQDYKLLSNSIKERYAKIKNRKEKRILKNALMSGNIDKCRKKGKLLQEVLGINREYTVKSTKSFQLLRKTIHQFFLRDEVSRATAGKKETVTRNGQKVQKRFIMDNMKVLYKHFKEENPNLKCSYYYFTKNRPFFVISASVDARETCLCKTHANITHKTQALKKHCILKTSDLNVLIKTTLCNDLSKDCMYHTCYKCKDKKIEYFKEKVTGIIKYSKWIRKETKYEKDGKTLKAIKNIKEVEIEDAAHALQTFEKELHLFKKHVYNIKTQFRSFRRA